jgi:hypothetical protein
MERVHWELDSSWCWRWQLGHCGLPQSQTAVASFAEIPWNSWPPGPCLFHILRHQFLQPQSICLLWFREVMIWGNSRYYCSRAFANLIKHLSSILFVFTSHANVHRVANQINVSFTHSHLYQQSMSFGCGLSWGNWQHSATNYLTMSHLRNVAHPIGHNRPTRSELDLAFGFLNIAALPYISVQRSSQMWQAKICWISWAVTETGEKRPEAGQIQRQLLVGPQGAVALKAMVGPY